MAKNDKPSNETTPNVQNGGPVANAASATNVDNANVTENTEATQPQAEKPPAEKPPAEKPGADTAKSDTVKTRAGVPRFCRGGYCFTQEPVTLNVADLSDEQLLAIKAETNLVVV